MKNVSIIILNYNDSDTTMRLVDTILEWESPQLDTHIIIVDNCSNDGSLQKLNEKYAWSTYVDVLQAEKNGGYSYGNNFGTKYAIKTYGSQYIAIANPDILIKEKMFIELLNTFDADQKISMCSPVMRDRKGNYSICVHSLPRFRDDLRECFRFKYSKTIPQKKYVTIKGYPKMIVTEMLPGSFFVVRSDYYQEVGMLDEGVFLFCEERIIGNRMKKCGYKLILR